MSSIPYFTLGAPGVSSDPVKPSQNSVQVSAYTGEEVGRGPMPFGVISDAPVGHKNHGKPYHGGIQLPSDPNIFMLHRLQGRKS